MWISGVAAPSFDYSESSGYGHPSFTDGSKVWTLSRKLSSVKKRDDDCPRGLLSGPIRAKTVSCSASNCRQQCGSDVGRPIKIKILLAMISIVRKISLEKFDCGIMSVSVGMFALCLLFLVLSQNHFMTWDWQTPGVEQTWCSGAGCVGPTTACLMVPTTAESTKHSATEDLSKQTRDCKLLAHTQWRKVTLVREHSGTAVSAASSETTQD